MNCFAVKLVDGTILDMFDECNHVSYNEENVCIFSVSSKKQKKSNRKEKNIMINLEDRVYENMEREGIGIIQIKP